MSTTPQVSPRATAIIGTVLDLAVWMIGLAGAGAVINWLDLDSSPSWLTVLFAGAAGYWVGWRNHT
jgi:hypothetical protein